MKKKFLLSNSSISRFLLNVKIYESFETVLSSCSVSSLSALKFSHFSENVLRLFCIKFKQESYAEFVNLSHFTNPKGMKRLNFTFSRKKNLQQLGVPSFLWGRWYGLWVAFMIYVFRLAICSLQKRPLYSEKWIEWRHCYSWRVYFHCHSVLC